MNKDFDSWNEVKKGLDSYDVFLPIKEGGVWWCSVGMNVGIEMCGKGWLFKIIYKYTPTFRLGQLVFLNMI